MKEFTLGLVAGFSIFLAISYIFPENIKGVNRALIKAGMAKYNVSTGDVEWIKKTANDIKEKE